MQRCFGCMKEFGKEYDICPHCGYAVNTLPVTKSHLAPGVVLGQRYILGKVLGCGGFGITYIAWDKNLDRAVAVKEFFPNAFSTRGEDELTVSCYDSKATEHYNKGIVKMLDEAKRLSKFAKNKNIVDIHDFFKENNTAYIVMEYLEGKDFKKYLEEKEGRISPKEAVNIILPVINALKDMHSVNTIHRDISPDNIFICDNGEVKLLDFGSARLAVSDDVKTMSVIVKEGYAPPEQYASRAKQGTYTDVYAVCATLYKAITGERPVNGLEREMLPLKKFSQFGIKGYDKLEKTIVKGLEPAIKDRIQTAEELEYLLTTAMNPGIVKTEKPPKNKNNKYKNKKLITALCAVLAVAVIAAGAFGIVKLLDRPSSAPTGEDLPSPVGDDSGMCGETVEWNYDEETGELIISGSGDMYDYDESNQSPWFGNSFNRVVIEEGITSIGTSAFSNTQIGEVVIPESVTDIGFKTEELPQEGEDGISIAASVTGIPESPFEFANVGEFTVVPENEYYSSEDGVLFGNNGTLHLICYPAGSELTEYEIPSDVTWVYPGAFYGARNLVEVYIPEMCSICPYAFSGTNLTAFDVSEDNPGYSSEDGVLFNADKTALICYPNAKEGESYKIPDTVKTIRACAFDECDMLKSINIPEGVAEIEDGAFRNCENLGFVVIPTTVESIGEDVINADTYICSASEGYVKDYADENGITFKKAEQCGDTLYYTFDKDTGALSIFGSGDMDDFDEDVAAPWNKEKITSVSVADGITHIGSWAFDETGANSIDIPESVISIGEGAFAGCQFTSIEIPVGVTVLSDNLFQNCNKLEVINIPANVNYLGVDFLFGCTSLKRISVDSENRFYFADEDGVLYNYNKSILWKFPPASELKAYNIPPNVTLLDASFSECNLESIAIPTTIKEIPNYAFCQSKIKRIVLHNGITSIGNYAFSNCKNLESITVPHGVETIGAYAFEGCNFSSITLNFDKIDTIGTEAFKGWTSSQRIYIEFSDRVVLFKPENKANEKWGDWNGGKAKVDIA